MQWNRTLVAALAAGIVVAQGCEQETPPPAGEVGTGAGVETPPAPLAEAVDAEPDLDDLPPLPAVAGQAPAAGQGQLLASSEMVFPTGEAESSLIKIAVSGDPEGRVGELYDYQILVTNLSDNITLDGVTVRQQLAESFAIDQAQPEHQMQQGEAVWNVGMLAPGQTRTINVSGVPESEGPVNACIRVSYNPALCTTFMVTQPQLQLQKFAPELVSICEPVNIRYVITNPGTAATEPVVLRDPLPEGLVTAEGAREVQLEVGAIPPGEGREVTVIARAQQKGQFTSRAIAATQGGLEVRSAATTTEVWAPSLNVQVSGPQVEYIRSPLNYTITVSNTGDGPTQAGRLLVQVDPDTQLLAPDLELAEGVITVPMQPLEPGQTQEYMLTLTKSTAGELTIVANAESPCAQQEQPAQVVTNIRAISALLLEVVDNEDPLRVGLDEVYQIVVMNQGSAADTNIQIVANLPEQFEFLEATGATQGQAEGNRITFAPLPSLAPGEEARWMVRAAPAAGAAQGQEVQDLRFRVEMTSESLTKPVIETESTKLVPQ